MILTGQLDSPFVRRVAIAMHIYGLEYEHSTISAFDDFGQLLSLNPLGKVPALQLLDGTVLMDSALILDYLDHRVGAEKALLPNALELRTKLLPHVGVAVGLAEKAVEYRGETVRRAPEKHDMPRIERVMAQLAAALAWLEAHTPENGFLGGERLTHADIASACAVTFITNKNAEHLSAQVKETEAGYPKLLAHTARCEMVEAFQATPFPGT